MEAVNFAVLYGHATHLQRPASPVLKLRVQAVQVHIMKACENRHAAFCKCPACATKAMSLLSSLHIPDRYNVGGWRQTSSATAMSTTCAHSLRLAVYRGWLGYNHMYKERMSPSYATLSAATLNRTDVVEVVIHTLQQSRCFSRRCISVSSE